MGMKQRSIYVERQIMIRQVMQLVIHVFMLDTGVQRHTYSNLRTG